MWTCYMKAGCWCRPTGGPRSDGGRSRSLALVSGTIFNLTLRLLRRWPSLDGAWRQNFFAAATMLPDCSLLLQWSLKWTFYLGHFNYYVWWWWWWWWWLAVVVRRRFEDLLNTNTARIYMREFSSRWKGQRLALVNSLMFAVIALIVFLLRGAVPTAYAGAALVYALQVCQCGDVVCTPSIRVVRMPRPNPTHQMSDQTHRRPGLPVSDWPGTGVSGRRLSAYFRRQHAPTPIERHSDVRRPTFK